MKKIHLDLAVIALAVTLLLTTSYAWILSDGEIGTYTVLKYDYSEENTAHNLSVSSQDVRMEVYHYDAETDGFVLTTDENPFVIQDFVPNETVAFKIRLYNSAQYIQTAMLAINRIQCQLSQPVTSPDFDPLSYLVISVTPGQGYLENASDITKPEGLFLKMNELSGTESANTMILYQNLDIPVSRESVPYIELDCYFWLDSRAGNEFQNAVFTIGDFFLVL